MLYKYLLLIGALLVSFLVSAQKSDVTRQLKAYQKEGVGKVIETKGVKPDAIITTAKKFLGTKHRMGGTSYKGLDCSGLVYVSFSEHGIQLPRSSSEQGRCGKQITSVKSLRKGDLVFFHMDWNRKRLVNHVGIYLGDGQFIHVSTSKGCIVSDLNSDVWQAGFLFGTRLLKE